MVNGFIALYLVPNTEFTPRVFPAADRRQGDSKTTPCLQLKKIYLSAVLYYVFALICGCQVVYAPVENAAADG
jgi:hypothetical protein